jgi:hypothetical protein
MACDTMLKPGQSIQQRATEVRAAVTALDKALAAGRARIKIGPTGAVAFDGITAEERNAVTDACMYRRIMATGSPLAKAKIAAAEALSGRTINRQAIAHGHHSHDGGKTWHKGH